MMSESNKTIPVEKEESPVEATAASPSPSSPPPPKSPVTMTLTESGRVETEIGKFRLEIEAKQVPLVGFLMASFVFMIAALARKTALRNWYGYAVAIGVVGMAIGLAGLILLKYKSELDQKYLAYFMLLWSIVGACTMTFGTGPFTVTGNGYFAVWAMVIFSLQHCGATQQAKETVQSLSSLAGLGVASIIMIIAIAYEVGVDDDRGNAIYALVLSCLSIVLVGAIMFIEQKTDMSFPAIYQFYTLAVFAIMWIVAACLLTFNGPFTVTGNGYFTAWAAAVVSVFAALAARQKSKQEENPV